MGANVERGQYRKKPLVVDAVKYTGDNGDKITAWLGRHAYAGRTGLQRAGIVIRTQEGDMIASPGDWVIRGTKGEFYPCKPDIFEATYEPA